MGRSPTEYPRRYAAIMEAISGFPVLPPRAAAMAGDAAKSTTLRTLPHRTSAIITMLNTWFTRSRRAIPRKRVQMMPTPGPNSAPKTLHSMTTGCRSPEAAMASAPRKRPVTMASIMTQRMPETMLMVLTVRIPEKLLRISLLSVSIVTHLFYIIRRVPFPRKARSAHACSRMIPAPPIPLRDERAE